MWLSHSKRCLDANWLGHALGVQCGSTGLDAQNIPAIETLLGCSLGLVTLEVSADTVRHVHNSLQEHLFNNTDLFYNPDSAIAQICLTYLNFQYIKDLSPIHDGTSQTAPLLEYISYYWGSHSREGIAASVNTLALRLLDGSNTNISSGIVLSHSGDNWDHRARWSNPGVFKRLHGSAYLGIAERAVGLLDMMKWDLGTTDLEGNTAMLWAATKGHDTIVNTLLEQESGTPNTTDQVGRKPLSWTARNRCEGALKDLLEKEGLTPHTPDKGGSRPHSWAAGNGYGGIVEIL